MSNRSGEARIYLARHDGSNATPLALGDSPAWSRDGQRIAFHRAATGIHMINTDGTNEKFLREGYNPTWSPDGTKIAFQTGIGFGGVFVMNADGSNPVLLISHEFANPGSGDYCVCSPAWSPDGARIAFVRSNYEDVWQIFTIKTDGSGTPEPLANNNGTNATQDAPAWSPDGSRIVFATVTTGGDAIGSLGLDGSGFEINATNSAGYVGEPDWTNDGRSVVFNRSAPRGTPTRIFIARANGTVEQLVPDAADATLAGYSDHSPAWSRNP